MVQVTKKATATATAAPATATATAAPATATAIPVPASVPVAGTPKHNHAAAAKAQYTLGFNPAHSVKALTNVNPWHKPGTDGRAFWAATFGAANPPTTVGQLYTMAQAAGFKATGLQNGIPGHLSWLYTWLERGNTIAINGCTYAATGLLQPTS